MKYTGALKKGIVRKRFGLLADEDDYKAEAMRITHERFEKLPDLFHVDLDLPRFHGRFRGS